MSGVFGANTFPEVTLTSAAFLVLCVMPLSRIGGWPDRNLPGDVLRVLIFGVFGYLCYKNRYPIVSLMGLVLGPMVAENFYRGLQIGMGRLIFPHFRHFKF